MTSNPLRTPILKKTVTVKFEKFKTNIENEFNLTSV